MGRDLGGVGRKLNQNILYEKKNLFIKTDQNFLKMKEIRKTEEFLPNIVPWTLPKSLDFGLHSSQDAKTQMLYFIKGLG